MAGYTSMALDPSNSSNLEQLALKRLIGVTVEYSLLAVRVYCSAHYAMRGWPIAVASPWGWIRSSTTTPACWPVGGPEHVLLTSFLLLRSRVFRLRVQSQQPHVRLRILHLINCVILHLHDARHSHITFPDFCFFYARRFYCSSWFGAVD